MHPHTSPRDFVPTPEPTGSLPPVIASVTVLGEFDYRVTRIANEGDQIHVSLLPRRDPDRNRLRELYVDARPSSCRRLSRPTSSTTRTPAHHVYPMLFTVTLAWMHNMPIVTQIHGTPTYQADAEYLGRDATVDYDFNDITFPDSLPDWYFDPRSYAHTPDDRVAPSYRHDARVRSEAFGLIELRKIADVRPCSFGRSLKTMYGLCGLCCAKS